MLAVPADRLPAALADLDPGNRALLDLSLRRGVSDAEIGELLRKDPNEVARGREAVLGLLADALDVDGHDRRERVRRAVAELPDDAWRGAPPQTEPDVVESVTEGTHAELEDDEDDEDDNHRPDASEPSGRPVVLEPLGERRSRKGRLLALVGLLVVIAALIALISGGDDDSDKPAANSADHKQQTPPPPATDKGVALKSLGGGSGSGHVAATGDGRLVITLKGLPKPDGTYQVWLYNGIIDALALGTFREGNGRLEVRLPANADRYRYLDVSLEPADSNRNHSGASVLRAPLAKLLPQ
jgi:hypothetical protein